MPEQDIHREFGRIEGQLLSLKERMDRFEEDVGRRLASIELKIDKLATIAAQGQGGIKIAGLLWTVVGGAVISALTYFITHKGGLE